MDRKTDPKTDWRTVQKTARILLAQQERDDPHDVVVQTAFKLAIRILDHLVAVLQEREGNRGNR